MAEAEAVEAACWYNAQSSGLGYDFLAKYEQALAGIENSPDRYPRLETLQTERDIRRCVLKRFPYYIVYENFSSETVVLAVAHASRRPNYWQNRQS